MRICCGGFNFVVRGLERRRRIGFGWMIIVVDFNFNFIIGNLG